MNTSPYAAQSDSCEMLMPEGNLTLGDCFIKTPYLSDITTALNYTPSVIFHKNGIEEVVRFDQDGKVFWLGREVESDDEFKAAMMDVHKVLCGSAC